MYWTDQFPKHAIKLQGRLNFKYRPVTAIFQCQTPPSEPHARLRRRGDVILTFLGDRGSGRRSPEPCSLEHDGASQVLGDWNQISYSLLLDCHLPCRTGVLMGFVHVRIQGCFFKKNLSGYHWIVWDYLDNSQLLWKWKYVRAPKCESKTICWVDLLTYPANAFSRQLCSYLI